MVSHPLRRALLLHPLLAIGLPFLVMVVLGLLWIPPQIRVEIEQRQLQLARAIGAQVESYLQEGAAMVKLAAAINRAPLPPSSRQPQLDALLESTASMSSLYVLKAPGRVVDVALKRSERQHLPDLIGLDLSANPLYKELSRDEKPHWSKTFLSVIHGGLVTAYGLRDNGTTFIGEINLDFLTKFLQQVSSENGQYILVIDHNGQVVADNNGRFTAQQLNIRNIPLVRSGLGSDKSLTEDIQFAGTKMIGSLVPIPSVDWHILVAKSKTTLFDTAWKVGKIILTGVLCAVLAGLLTSILLSRKLAVRFEALTRHAQAIAGGGDSGVWPRSSIAEFNQLSENLQQMARRLQDSEILYRTLFEQLPDGVVLWDIPASTPRQFNTAACTQLGYTQEEFAALSVQDFNVSVSPDEIARREEILTQQGLISFEAVHRTKTGDDCFVMVTLRKIDLAARPMILAIHRDITARKMAEDEMRNTHMLLDMFMEHSPIYTFIKEVTPTESRVLQASRNYLEMLGIPASEMTGKTMAELFPPDLAASMTADDWRVVTNNRVLEAEEKFNGRTYTSIKFPILRGERTLLAGYTIDITDRKRNEEERLSLEKQLLYAQKLESLGVLAGGIAHDFNNILLAITGNAEMALRRIDKGASPAEYLQRIKQAAGKAAGLAHQMLAYSGKGKFQIETLDLNQLLEESLEMLEVSISKKVTLHMDLKKPLPYVEADATQLRQIVMNLVINASEAIGDKAGDIIISTSSKYCTRKDLISQWGEEELPEGKYLWLEVTDNGCGMDKNTLARLFDPFFTTKFTGRGLGMAAVLGIVRSHKGVIVVDSTPGKGSHFKILLPISGKPVELPGEEALKCEWRGSGRILLVDDEEVVRDIGTDMLKDLGFDVLTANDGQEALDIYRTNEGIDLVILDLTMPRMDGEQCFQELKKLNPDVRVVLSSGYNEQDIAEKIADPGAASFLPKPYVMEVLSETIQKAISKSV